MNTFKPAKTSNSKCRSFVQNRINFQGHNLFGQYIGNKFVVYSYGYHFPLFAYINDQWYENSDRYSVSTTKQQGQSHPLVNTIKVSVSELKNLIEN